MIRKTETKGPREADTTKRSRGHDWPMDVRLKLVRAVVEQGLSGSEVAKRLGVPYTTAMPWVRRYRVSGAAGFEARVRPAVKKRDRSVGKYRHVHLPRDQEARGREHLERLDVHVRRQWQHANWPRRDDHLDKL